MLKNIMVEAIMYTSIDIHTLNSTNFVPIQKPSAASFLRHTQENIWLQNKQEMKASRLFQICAFAIHTTAFIAFLRLTGNPVTAIGFGSHWKFLTIWTHTLNVIFYTLCVINMVPKSYLSWLFKLSFTSSVCVSALFWGILFLNPNAFKIGDFNYPLWLDHAQHTVPCIVALFELILVDYAYHSLIAELAVIFSFAGSYLAFTFYLKKVNGYYPYPFMESFTRQHWIGFIIFSAILASVVHIAGRFLSAAIHKKPSMEHRNKQIKQQ
jgi:hypothetical protein